MIYGTSGYHFFVPQKPISGIGRLIVEILDHTHTHTAGKTPLNECSARHRSRYLHTTQQTQVTNIHTLSGIRIRDPRNQAAADLRLRPHSHRDRPLAITRTAKSRRFRWTGHVACIFRSRDQWPAIVKPLGP